MAGDVVLGDAAAAVAVVEAPVGVGEDGGVNASDPAVGAIGETPWAFVCDAVGGDAAKDLEVGLNGKVGKRESDAGAEESADHVA